MDTCEQMIRGAFLLLGSVVLIYVLVKLVMWARKGCKGAILLGAFLVIFTPDPVYEKNCKSVHKAKQKVECSGESGDPPLPEVLINE